MTPLPPIFERRRPLPSIFDLQIAARSYWDTLPREGGGEVFEGTPMTCREARFRREYVEPMMDRIDTAYKSGEISIEDHRLAAVAVMSPIPSRRMIRLGRRRMTELEAIAELFHRGVPCRSAAQVAAGAMTDLPWVGDVAASNGIEVYDPEDDDEESDDLDDEDDDLE